MFFRLIFPPRESDESHSHSNMVRGLVPSMSDMSTEIHSHSVMVRGLVPSMIDMSADSF